MLATMIVLMTVNLEDGTDLEDVCLDLDRATTKVVSCDTADKTVGTIRGYETVSVTAIESDRN
jgi:hypothetical protein